MDESDLAAAEADLAQLSMVVDTASHRLPPNARRAMLPHERRAGVHYADIETDCQQGYQQLWTIMRRNVLWFIDELFYDTIDLSADQIAGWFLYFRRTGGLYKERYASQLDKSTREIYLTLDDLACAGWLSVASENLTAPVLMGEGDLLRQGSMDASLDGAAQELVKLAWHVASGPLETVLDIIIKAAVANIPWQEMAAGLELKGPSVEYGRVPAVRAHRRGRVIAQAVAMGSVIATTAAVSLWVNRQAQQALDTTLEPDPGPDEGTMKASNIYASELLDPNTCVACEEVDGTNYSTMAAALRDYPEGTYVKCLAGPRCRGMLVVVWSEETSPAPMINIPPTVRAMRNKRGETIAPKAITIPPPV